MTRRYALCASVIAAALVLAACQGLFATKIGTIKADPRKFEGKTVTIQGTVTASANLLFIKGYWVEDDTGKLVVVTEEPVPAEGAKVTVTGKITQALAVGSSSTLILTEEKKGPKGE